MATPRWAHEKLKQGLKNTLTRSGLSIRGTTITTMARCTMPSAVLPFAPSGVEVSTCLYGKIRQNPKKLLTKLQEFDTIEVYSGFSRPTPARLGIINSSPANNSNLCQDSNLVPALKTEWCIPRALVGLRRQWYAQGAIATQLLENQNWSCKGATFPIYLHTNIFTHCAPPDFIFVNCSQAIHIMKSFF